MTRKPEKVKVFMRVLEHRPVCDCFALPSQYKCSSEMVIPQRFHLQCCFADLWQQTGKTADWFEAHLDKIQPFIDEKRCALASYKSCPVRGHSKCLGQPEAKSNRFQGVVQMTFDFSCAITYRSVLTQAI